MQSRPDERHAPASTKSKRPYRKPTLSVHGSAAALTGSPGGRGRGRGRPPLGRGIGRLYRES